MSRTLIPGCDGCEDGCGCPGECAEHDTEPTQPSQPGGSVAPYRVPCPGEPATITFDHGKTAEVNALVATNITQVANWDTGVGGMIDPYPRPNPSTACTTPDCSPEHPACGKVYLENDFDTPTLTSILACYKKGFKSLQAKRQWHGCFPWDSHDPAGCADGITRDSGFGDLTYETVQGSASQTKYLDKTYTGTIGWSYTGYLRWSVLGLDDPDDPAPFHTFEYSYLAEIVSEINTDPASGARVRSPSFVKSVTETYSIDGVEYTSADTDIWSTRGIAFSGPVGTYGGVEYTNDAYSLTNMLAFLGSSFRMCDEAGLVQTPGYELNSPGKIALSQASVLNGGIVGSSPSTHLAFDIAWTDGAGVDKESHAVFDATWTPTKYTFIALPGDNYSSGDWIDSTDGVTASNMDVQYHCDISVELSNTNTAASVRSDVVDLINEWDLSDHKQYPFRTDSHPRMCPLVTRDEYPYNQGPEGVAALGDSFTDETDHDGSIIGQPTADLVDRYWDWMMDNYDTCGESVFNCLGTNGLNSFGAFSNDPTYGCFVNNATHWLNRMEECDNFPAAYFHHAPGGAVRMQVYLEVLSPWPSYNFARPYGKDRLLYDQTSIDCGSALPNGTLLYEDAPGIVTPIAVTSATQDGANLDIVLAAAAVLKDGDSIIFAGISGVTTGAVSGVGSTPTSTATFSVIGLLIGPYTSGGTAVSADAPAYYFDDSQRKGDYVVLIYKHNYRDVGEAERVAAWIALCEATVDAPDWDCTAAGSGDPIRSVQDGRGMPNTVEDFQITQSCMAWNKCNPIIVGFHPTMTSTATIRIYPIPTDLDLDDRYGVLWQGIVVQSMVDPLWETPATGGFFCPDPSELEDCTPPRVEAIADIPDTFGADGDESPPALPAGKEIHVVTLAELQGVSAPDGKVIPPPNNGANVDMPWLLISADVCEETGGGGQFAPHYNEPGY
jgi:hypothetical protein